MVSKVILLQLSQDFTARVTAGLFSRPEREDRRLETVQGNHGALQLLSRLRLITDRMLHKHHEGGRKIERRARASEILTGDWRICPTSQGQVDGGTPRHTPNALPPHGKLARTRHSMILRQRADRVPDRVINAAAALPGQEMKQWEMVVTGNHGRRQGFLPIGNGDD